MTITMIGWIDSIDYDEEDDHHGYSDGEGDDDKNDDRVGW